MAGKGISINFLADVKDFLRGTNDVEGALDDVADSLDDVVKEGDQATGKLEDSFKDLARAAKTSGDNVGDGFKKGFKEASQGSEDLAENTKANAKEVGASFDGSIESIVDGFQGLAAEAFEGFGPAGVAAGVAVAAGIGLASSSIIETEEKAKAARDRIRELGLAIIDSGEGSAVLNYVTENLKEIITNGDDATKKFKDILALSKKFPGLADDVGLMAVAFAGNSDAADVMIAKLEEAADAEQALSGDVADGDTAFQARANELRNTADELRRIQDETRQAQQAEEDWLASGGAEIEGKRLAIEGINGAYDDAVNAVGDFLDKETGILNVEAYLKGIDDRKKALEEYQGFLATIDFTTEQKQALNDMGTEQAIAWYKGFQSTSDVNKERMKAALTEAASDSSGAAKDKMEEAFKEPVQAQIKANLDKLQAERELDNLTRQRRVDVQVRYVDKFGKEVQ
jgi:uncharacterized protein YktA (UPF0223 family)